MIVSLNGCLVKDTEACIRSTDRGFTLGDGLFETISVNSYRLLRLPAHLQRLRTGVRLLNISLLISDNELVKYLTTTLAANNLCTGVLRLTISRGATSLRGLLPPPPSQSVIPTVLITADPCLPAIRPIRAIISSVTRRNQHSLLSRIKSLNCLDNILARQEAHSRGNEDAILLNMDGRLAETTVANIFLVVNNKILTPKVEDGALPGIMREEILSKIDVVETTITTEELFQATEIFVTNSTGIRPLIEVEGKLVGSSTQVQEKLSNKIKTRYIEHSY